jgi:hypothetical protein
MGRFKPSNSESVSTSSTEKRSIVGSIALDIAVVSIDRQSTIKVVEEGAWPDLFSALSLDDGPNEFPDVHIPDNSYGIGGSHASQSALVSIGAKRVADGTLEAPARSNEQFPAKRQNTEGSVKYWACPFSKHDADRYDEIYNSCTDRPGFASLKTLS